MGLDHIMQIMQGALLLTWINFTPSMDKYLYNKLCDEIII